MLQGTYPSVEDIAATQLGQSTAPIGTPRQASMVPLPGAPAVVPLGGVIPAAASAPASAPKPQKVAMASVAGAAR
jgi:penicillin-binding protein 2